MRRNHFHTGLDIKTAGVEGQNIRAAEAGKVARIAISPWGYGKALYIAHDNGYTTVYAHLSSFSEKIDAVTKAEQYAQQSYAVDFAPDPPIPVDRAELIAMSGNSGSSGGPHLHFEIRTTGNSRPQNPLNFGFDIKDNIAPRIRGVRFHPLTENSLVNGSAEPKSFVVLGEAGKYHLKAGQSINVYGTVGLSLHALDFLDGQSNKCGIYSLELEIDGKLICKQQFDELDFSTSRHINCYKDYTAFRNSGWHYHKSFIEPGNQLEIYPIAPPDSGRVTFSGSGTHEARYIATDAHGNKSELNFTFTSLDAPNGAFARAEPYDAFFFRNQDNSFDYGNELHLSVPAYALYRDIKFQFGREMPTSTSLSPYYSLHNDMEPLDKNIRVAISMEGVPARLKDKVVVARYAAAGSPQMISGEMEGDYYVVKMRDFGRFCLMADTVAPNLSANKYSQGGAVNARSVLGFNISDNRSGIKTYSAMLNGEWTLLEYEPKKSLLFMKVGDANFQKGSNTLEITITDNCGNATVKKFSYSL